MPLQFSIIPPVDAINQWNKFAFSQVVDVPFSFNPSLFFFYQNHYIWKPYYLLLYQNNGVVGLLPIVNTGKAWVSLPHFSYGGLLTGSESLALNQLNLTRSFIEYIIQNRLESGFYQIDLDQELNDKMYSQSKVFIRLLGNQTDHSFIESEKVTSLIKLTDTIETTFDKLSSNLKRKIRKGDRNKLEIKQGGIALINDFYNVYAKNIHFLKSLNYSKRFFNDLFASYDNGSIIFFVAYRNEKPVGSAVLASYGGFYENIYFATLPEERKYYIADWLHWQMIKYVTDSEISNQNDGEINRIYSFGRSTKSSSVHKFKSHWPVTDVPLYAYSDIPDLRNNNLIQKVWGTLPYFISKPLGSKLIKHIY